MKRLYKQDDWKKTWKDYYRYDLLEVYGEIRKNLGYSYAYENRRDNILSFIQTISKPGEEILDVAGAAGNITLKLAEMGYNVTWNDMYPDLAEYVEMKREKGVVRYKQGNIMDVQFEQLFDVILAAEIIEHVAHPDEFIAYLSTLLKPGGHLILSTPLGSYFKNGLPKFTEFKNPQIFESKQFKPNADGHIFLLHLDEIPIIIKKTGLEIIRMKYYTNPLTNGHIKLSILLKVLPKKMVFAMERFSQRLPEFIGRKIHTNFSMLLQKNNNPQRSNLN